MMKNNLKIWFTGAACLFAVACGSSSSSQPSQDISDSATRNVRGSVAHLDSSDSSFGEDDSLDEDNSVDDVSSDDEDIFAEDDNDDFAEEESEGEQSDEDSEGGDEISCQADTVIVTDTGGGTVAAEVQEDCTFSLDLVVGESYTIGFVLDDVFVATLLFNDGMTQFSTDVFPVTTEEDIDLGVVTINGDVAFPENEPLSQCDFDDDGESDLNDEDDDNDGVEDWDEIDCDDDGIPDDFDDETWDCEIDENFVRIIEFKPRNDPHPDKGNDSVDLDAEVHIRVACLVDEETVNEDTFSISTSDDETLSCDFGFENSSNGIHQEIQCEHEDFQADTVYTVTVDGIQCQDGSWVESQSWSFLADDSKGHGKKKH